MATKTEKDVRRWMREKETRPDPNHFFTIQEIREVEHVPERHEIVNYTNAWELTCRFQDLDMDYDVTKTVYVLEKSNGTLHSSSDDYGNDSSPDIFYDEYGL